MAMWSKVSPVPTIRVPGSMLRIDCWVLSPPMPSLPSITQVVSLVRVISWPRILPLSAQARSTPATGVAKLGQPAKAFWYTH